MNVINIGEPTPLGSSITPKGVNFCVAATNANFIEILIFENENSVHPTNTFKLDTRFNTGSYWHAEIEGLKEGTIYAYRVHQKENGPNNDYSHKILIDPCSRGIVGWEKYKREKTIDKSDNMSCCLKSVVCEREKFNFKQFPRPKHSWEKSIIYELHIVSFTQEIPPINNNTQESPFQKILKKIPYLKDLGVTTIELLPIFCFDPGDSPNGLENFWGYSPINWFTPHFQYFSEELPKKIREEFKRFVEECHTNNIEVILDVVYNHTSEGNIDGPAISWKGIDENLYYFIDKHKKFQDVSGCGNTIAANRSIVKRLIIESLKCWANELGIDGFRFDLGVALTRGENLIPLDNPPLFDDIEHDPELFGIKLISEPWDCGGLYKINDFPSDKTFTWNGHFRDDVRRFWKGEENTAWNMRDKLLGSPSIYKKDNIYPKTINLITSHDGFTLKDLVSFNGKHNFANREHNRDGENSNNSWNHGVEGPTTNQNINRLRNRQQKNFLFSLFISRGVPMMLMGDEIGRTQGGNNNTWCQNNSLGWMSWNNLEQDQELLNFVKLLIKVRNKFQKFINPQQSEILNTSNLIEYKWHGTNLDNPDWGSWSHTIAFSINRNKQPLIWIGLNAYSKDIKFTLPTKKGKWNKIIDTYRLNTLKITKVEEEFIELKDRSSVLIVSDEIIQNDNQFI